MNELPLDAAAPIRDRRSMAVDALVALGRELLRERERPLQRFVSRFVDQPKWHRDLWHGQCAERHKRLSDIQRRALDLLGTDPDLLGPAGQRYDETTHTSTLAWALNHEALRTETRAALIALLRCIAGASSEPGRFEFTSLPVDKLAVCSERTLPGFGRVDLWMACDSHVLAIEAKLLSGEGGDQTKRYNDAKMHHGPGKQWQVVFLTLDPEQTPAGAALHITFRDLLIAWLPVAAAGQSGAHRHLGAYLASVARILGIGRSGSFEDWSFIERRMALDIVEAKEKP